jgi:hypothetical protein
VAHNAVKCVILTGVAMVVVHCMTTLPSAGRVNFTRV